MNHFLASFTKALSLSILVVMGLAACNPQGKAKPADTTDTPPKVPRMWMDDASSKRDEDHYTSILPILTTQLGQPETDSIFYSLTAFKEMIDTFRAMPNIAFLDICPAADPGAKTLSVLYVPEDSTCNPLGYFQLPANATTFSQAGNMLTFAQFQNWSDTYAGTAVTWMKPQLDGADPANYIDGNRLTPIYNTLHASHWFNDLTELYDELTYQGGTLKMPITGVEAFFALKPTRAPGTRGGFSNRLYVILEFTTDDANRKHQKFYINTSGRQFQQPDPPSDSTCYLSGALVRSADTSRKPKWLGGNNNGQLCPPTCNP